MLTLGDPIHNLLSAGLGTCPKFKPFEQQRLIDFIGKCDEFLKSHRPLVADGRRWWESDPAAWLTSRHPSFFLIWEFKMGAHVQQFANILQAGM
jgi:hypothetical protein